MNKEKNICSTFEKFRIVLVMALLVVSHPVYANRLAAAAQRGQSFLLSMGQVTSVVGLLLGGVMMTLGISHVGKMILLSSLLGAMVIFGGPSMIEVVRSLFQ